MKHLSCDERAWLQICKLAPQFKYATDRDLHGIMTYSLQDPPGTWKAVWIAIRAERSLFSFPNRFLCFHITCGSYNRVVDWAVMKRKERLTFCKPSIKLLTQRFPQKRFADLAKWYCKHGSKNES